MSARGFAADLWLFIAANGRTTLEDIRANFTPEDYSETLRSRVKHLVEYGALHRYAPGIYGVTPACRVPIGLTVAEILEATGATA